MFQCEYSRDKVRRIMPILPIDSLVDSMRVEYDGSDSTCFALADCVGMTN